MKDLDIIIPMIGLILAGYVAGIVDCGKNAEAAVTTTLSVPCTNYNWEHSPYCTAPVDYFFTEDNGEVWGYLTSGAMFQQRNVTNELGVRLQRFTMEEVSWFITDRGVIHADSNAQALSIYLAK
jgi:hypothetical protein